MSSSLDSRIALARLELRIAERDGPYDEVLRRTSCLNQLVAEAFNERCT